MNKLRFGEGLHTYPVYAPVAITTSAIASDYVKVRDAHWATFLVSFGAFGSSDDTDVYQLTVECSTANTSNATEQAVAFQYRLTGAVGTDTMGTIGTATSTGLEVKPETDENKTVLIEVNPDILPAALADGIYLRVVCTPPASDTDATGVMGIVSVLEPRYPGNSMASAT